MSALTESVVQLSLGKGGFVPKPVTPTKVERMTGFRIGPGHAERLRLGALLPQDRNIHGPTVFVLRELTECLAAPPNLPELGDVLKCHQFKCIPHSARRAMSLGNLVYVSATNSAKSMRWPCERGIFLTRCHFTAVSAVIKLFAMTHLLLAFWTQRELGYDSTGT